MEDGVDLTRDELFAEFDRYYGFRPGPKRSEVEQTVVTRELANIRHQISVLERKKMRMIGVAQKFNFRTD